MLAAAFLLPTVAPHADAQTPALGTTNVLKWKDGKKAVFMLEYDDSIPSDIKTALPELTRRGMVATFYVNPGGQAFKFYRQQWEHDVPKAGMVLANHTFTHKGVNNAEELDAELRQCNESIDACFPTLRKPRLISFGQPGGVPWKVTPEEMKAALAKYHLVERPPARAYPYNLKTKEDIVGLVDHVLATGETECTVTHGVGADWIITPIDLFMAQLDKLEANKAQLWITDPISWHQYVTERKTAVVKMLGADPAQVRVSLTCSADPVFYDMPLTLSTQVPATWRECMVTQGTKAEKAVATNGVLQYDALPGADTISIQPVGAR